MPENTGDSHRNQVPFCLLTTVGNRVLKPPDH